jgi:hypothetical protein
MTMKRQDIITDPELSKKLKAAGIIEEPILGFWYELRRVYKDHDHQRLARTKNKLFRWEFNLPKEKIPLYSNTSFSDEIGSYSLELADRIPAYTADELMGYLPVKIKIDDDYIRHIEIQGDLISIYYKSERTSFILGETVIDTSLTSAVARMIISLSMQGCRN